MDPRGHYLEHRQIIESAPPIEDSEQRATMSERAVVLIVLDEAVVQRAKLGAVLQKVVVNE